MNYFDWVTLALAVTLAVVCGVSFSAGYARRSLQHLPGSGGGLPPASLLPSIMRRLGFQTRFSAAAALVALLTTYLLLRRGSPTAAMADVYVAVAAAGIALGLGVAISSLTQQLRRPDTSIRLARLRVATINDYISVWNRIFAWVLIAAVVAIVVIRDQQALEKTFTASVIADLLPTNILATLAILGLALFEIAGRAIVSRPQPAATSEELVWDDALRASTLQGLLYGPVVYGAYDLLLVVIRGVVWDNSGRSIALFLLITAVIVCFFVNLLVLRETRERYLYRLWPHGPTEREVVDVVDVEVLGHAR